MELRPLLLTVFAVSLVAGLGATPVKRYHLDDRILYVVRVGTDAPTTVMFPGPLVAIDGAGVSVRAEDAPSILVSHQAGSRFFSVRALHPDATGAANIVFRERVYAFSFTAGDEPDRTVTFHDYPVGTGDRRALRPSPDRLLALLDQAKHYSVLSEQYPALVQRTERTTPRNTAVTGDIAATFEEVFRFDEEDALVFRVRLENRGTKALRYDPARLAIRISETNFPAALTDASGELPAGHATLVTVVIVGNPDATRGNLSVKNTFALAVPPLE